MSKQYSSQFPRAKCHFIFLDGKVFWEEHGTAFDAMLKTKGVKDVCQEYMMLKSIWKEIEK